MLTQTLVIASTSLLIVVILAGVISCVVWAPRRQPQDVQDEEDPGNKDATNTNPAVDLPFFGVPT